LTPDPFFAFPKPGPRREKADISQREDDLIERSIYVTLPEKLASLLIGPLLLQQKQVEGSVGRI
jgi:hypothetical protein